MSAVTRSYFLLPSLTLWWREMVRFIRQRSRIVGALGTPLVFWLVLGLGLGRSSYMPLAPKGHGYMEYFFAGTLVMVLLFTAIFSTISIIEDRREGFLQAVLVAPVGRLGLVLGKILGGTTLALGQGLLFLALAPVVGLRFELAGTAWTVGTMFILAFGLTGLGFVIAWQLDSTQGFHAIMNLFLIPLWLLSGAVFPSTGAPKILQWVMDCNPLSYGVAAIRHGLYWQHPTVAAHLPSKGLALGITAVFAVLMLLISLAASRRVTAGDLR